MERSGKYSSTKTATSSREKIKKDLTIQIYVIKMHKNLLFLIASFLFTTIEAITSSELQAQNIVLYYLKPSLISSTISNDYFPGYRNEVSNAIDKLKKLSPQNLKNLEKSMTQNEFATLQTWVQQLLQMGWIKDSSTMEKVNIVKEILKLKDLPQNKNTVVDPITEEELILRNRILVGILLLPYPLTNLVDDTKNYYSNVIKGISIEKLKDLIKYLQKIPLSELRKKEVDKLNNALLLVDKNFFTS